MPVMTERRKPSHVDPSQVRNIERVRVHLALLLATLATSSLIFAPISIWPLAYVCLVPWTISVCTIRRASLAHWLSYLLGFCFYLINMYWIWPVTGLGYVALSALTAIYYAFVAAVVRHQYRRRRMPLTIVLPFAVVGAEFLRGLVVAGFPWFYLAHSHYKILPMIQICDLAGAYGLSFVIAAVNGAVADVILRRHDEPGTRLKDAFRSCRVNVIAAAVLVVAVLGYGLAQGSRHTMQEGPRIAVLQDNHALSTDLNQARGVSQYDRASAYFAMMAQAAAHQPDMFLLPETPWIMYLNSAFQSLKRDEVGRYTHCWDLSKQSYEAFQESAQQYQAYITTGSSSLELNPTSVVAPEQQCNSAFVFAPDGRAPERYDKIHLVLFGEYVPFRFGRWRFLYLWLNSLSPWGQGGYEYSLTPGHRYAAFEVLAKSQDNAPYRFAVPICYEDAMAYICRGFVRGEDGNKRVDFLLNISNDGWFNRSFELPQHLAVCVFRAVENRVGVARAVNTGISGFIDPDGRIHDLVQVDGKTRGPEVRGFAVSNVMTDSRYAFYTRYGDWFAVMCTCIWGLAFLDACLFGRRPRAREDAEQEQELIT